MSMSGRGIRYVIGFVHEVLAGRRAEQKPIRSKKFAECSEGHYFVEDLFFSERLTNLPSWTKASVANSPAGASLMREELTSQPAKVFPKGELE